MTRHCLTLALLLTFMGSDASALTVWTGTRITFSKDINDDSSLAENQDRITDDVWITRAVLRGLYNAALETEDNQDTSPLGTLWALGTTDELGSLTFDTWNNVIRDGGNAQSSVGNDYVVQLVDDQVYFDLHMLTWNPSKVDSAVAYSRTTAAVPEPGSLGLLASFIAAATVARRRW